MASSSDGQVRYAPSYSRVIAANATEAADVLDRHM
jgi:hypothetical protein